ncbi:MAG: response regulator transcription factor [Betaproteobacteria bacterium]|nr:response regulator transcription factor [Betaproteobacteria bacterium]
MNDSIRLLIVDDHPLIREGIAALLREGTGVEVVGMAGNGQEAVEMAAQLRPDIVLMDYHMPIMNGLDATRQLRASLADVRVLILTQSDEPEYVVQVMEAGAAGYVLKSEMSQSKLLRTIAAVHDGVFVFPPVQANTPAGSRSARDIPLTAREIEVLSLTAQGKSAKEIGRMLKIDARTAETHRQNIREKLGVRTIAELTRYAVENGLG